MNMNELGSGGRRRIAVVGAGIAGLGAAWLLRQQHQVTLFEAEARLGGHAHTVDVTLEGQTHGVDTGFLVFNRRTYPHLCALFAALELPLAASDMSFSVQLQQPALEWSGRSLNSVFAQRSNLLRPAFWGMLQDILRFNRETTRAARENLLPALSLGEYLSAHGYSEAFRDWYLLPMAAAIWSCPVRQMLAYPLASFLRFCHNHGLLQVLDRPQWYTVRGGSREYVQRLQAALPDVRRASAVRAVQRDANGVLLRCAQGSEHFDAVVFATHSADTLSLLGEGASAAERAILGAIRYQANRAVLHTDTALLPQRRSAWSAWNYSAGSGAFDTRPVAVSYLINQLQPLPWRTPTIVSLNPIREPAPARVIASFEYAHPVFDAAAVSAQAHLPMIQGQQHSWFCGAWTGSGFHEDGLRSAVQLAAQFGAVAPWVAQPLQWERV